MKTVVVLASACMIAFSAAVRADDLKVLEERFAEVTDAAVPAAAAGWIRDAQRPDGSWDGVDYADKSRGIWQPSVGHLAKRVLVLARAYRATQDRTLADAAKRGLDWWVKSALVCPNWWWNEIGAPQDFAMSAILVSPVLSDEDRARYAEYLKCSRIKMTGQNRVWLARIVLMRGVIARDEAIADEAAKVIADELRVSDGPEGIMPDWSFCQHGRQLQFGNYGLSFVLDMSRLSRVFAGTKWEFSREKSELLGNLLERGFRWTVWNGHMDAAALGRQLVPGSSRKKAATVAKACAEFAAAGWKFSPEPVGFRFFPCGAYAVWRQDGWMASVKMHTRNVLETETWVNAENTLGGHMADGALYVYASGGEYDDVFPLWRNWRLVPGVTSYRDRPPVVRKYTESNGSNELDEMSARSGDDWAEVEFAIRREGLSARKRWRFGRGFVEASGSGISSDAVDSPVVTCVEHCLASSDAVVHPYSDGSLRFSNGGFEYEVFAPEGCVTVTIEEREGTWRGIHPAYAETPHRARVLCAYIDHGVAPKDASYRYRIVKKQTKENIK